MSLDIIRKMISGIRIENLVYINKNKFEELTVAPIERSLINKKILNSKELEWINNYHKKLKRIYRNILILKIKVILKKRVYLSKISYHLSSVSILILRSLAVWIF